MMIIIIWRSIEICIFSSTIVYSIFSIRLPRYDIELENDSRKRDLTTSQQKVDVQMAASTYSCRYIYICRETSIVMDMGSTGFGFSRERENDPVFPIRT